mmetsp:Transcript_16301/g.29033  ORF Transcript_16301/g.29033 Transcript_16301/m.29033 type:complete len:525 (-) Transcript_16301:343-1917(-)
MNTVDTGDGDSSSERGSRGTTTLRVNSASQFLGLAAEREKLAPPRFWDARIRVGRLPPAILALLGLQVAAFTGALTILAICGEAPASFGRYDIFNRQQHGTRNGTTGAWVDYISIVGLEAVPSGSLTSEQIAELLAPARRERAMAVAEDEQQAQHATSWLESINVPRRDPASYSGSLLIVGAEKERAPSTEPPCPVRSSVTSSGVGDVSNRRTTTGWVPHVATCSTCCTCIMDRRALEGLAIISIAAWSPTTPSRKTAITQEASNNANTKNGYAPHYWDYIATHHQHSLEPNMPATSAMITAMLKETEGSQFANSSAASSPANGSSGHLDASHDDIPFDGDSFLLPTEKGTHHESEIVDSSAAASLVGPLTWSPHELGMPGLLGLPHCPACRGCTTAFWSMPKVAVAFNHTFVLSEGASHANIFAATSTRAYKGVGVAKLFCIPDGSILDKEGKERSRCFQKKAQLMYAKVAAVDRLISQLGVNSDSHTLIPRVWIERVSGVVPSGSRYSTTLSLPQHHALYHQ